MTKTFCFLVAVCMLMSGCVSVTQESVSTMADQSLCDLADQRRYVTTFKEREIIYRELEVRGTKCGVIHHKKL